MDSSTGVSEWVLFVNVQLLSIVCIFFIETETNEGCERRCERVLDEEGKISASEDLISHQEAVRFAEWRKKLRACHEGEN